MKYTRNVSSVEKGNDEAERTGEDEEKGEERGGRGERGEREERRRKTTNTYA